MSAKILLSLLAFNLTLNISLQAQFIENAAPNFDKYAKRTVSEKVYLHSDKNTYIAGEYVWFSAYAVDATTNTTLDVSKVAYVELLNRQNKAVLQAKISLNKGRGAGSFYLPATFNSGSYTLRAYTNWMKNFDPDHYFHKSISVYNTLKEEKLQELPKSAIAKIHFFPEGGDLIDGLSSRVAFRAVDETGISFNFKGFILNERGDTIVRFNPLKNGIGSFQFTPSKTGIYQVLIKPLSGKSFFANFPEVLSNGYAIRVDNIADKDLKVSIKTNSISEYSVRVLVHSVGKVLFNKAVNLSNGAGETIIPKTDLADGISHITVFDDANKPVCERLHFKRPQKKLAITAVSDKQQYGKREAVKIEIANTTESNQVAEADLSISVHAADLSVEDEDISTFVYLSSELKGRIEDPKFYLTDLGQEALDNLMLTHGWRRFRWNTIEEVSSGLKYLPEIKGHIVSAKLKASTPELSLSGRIGYFSVPGRHNHFYTAKSNNAGELRFFTRNFYGPTDVIAQTDPRTDSLIRVEIVSPFSSQYSDYMAPSFTNPSPGLLPTLKQRSVASQVMNLFMSKWLKKEYPGAIDSIPFYLSAIKTYKLDDYVRFASMEEVLREYVAEIFVERKKKSYHLRVLDTELKELYSSGPLILLDGVPMFDEGDKIIRYDPQRIERLEVVNTTYFYGPTIFRGVANFYTYKGDVSGVELDPTVNVSEYEGMQLTREFYSPMYDGDNADNKRIPDFRTTLYWSASRQTVDGKMFIKLSTSDLPGKYRVIIQGIAKGGRLGSQSVDFEVKE